jgi:hypothetical protein
LAQRRSFKRDEDDLPRAGARAPQPVSGSLVSARRLRRSINAH